MATNGTGQGFGFGLNVSNAAIGVGGLVVLGAIGAHLISNIWAGPKKRALTVAHKTSEPTMMETMFAEAQAMATDPTVVGRNADRVAEAVKQRRDYIKTLRDKLHSGQISHQHFAHAMQQHASDVLDQLGIAQNPHPTSLPSDSIQLFKNQRIGGMTDRFAVPGGMILDPEERAWLEHQTMSYQGSADESTRFHLQETARKQAEEARLAALRLRWRERQAGRQVMIQADQEADALVQGLNERRRAGMYR